MGLDIKFLDADSCGNHVITANGVEIGNVSITCNQVLWSAGIQPSEKLKFSIKDEERLRKILQALIKYKDDNGYEDVIIRNCKGDIGTYYSNDVWDKLGFELAETSVYYRMKKN